MLERVQVTTFCLPRLLMKPVAFSSRMLASTSWSPVCPSFHLNRVVSRHARNVLITWIFQCNHLVFIKLIYYVQSTEDSKNMASIGIPYLSFLDISWPKPLAPLQLVHWTFPSSPGMGRWVVNFAMQCQTLRILTDLIRSPMVLSPVTPPGMKILSPLLGGEEMKAFARIALLILKLAETSI